ncbi:hypothetical protein H8356DRAFT_1429327 [Neocallimastix lanati (nom. inval.)]|nr:hypothetical protein H8356DRAFT_1429327 [Neocallimastix sp. JGI-2020a]
MFVNELHQEPKLLIVAEENIDLITSKFFDVGTQNSQLAIFQALLSTYFGKVFCNKFPSQKRNNNIIYREESQYSNDIFRKKSVINEVSENRRKCFTFYESVQAVVPVISKIILEEGCSLNSSLLNSKINSDKLRYCPGNKIKRLNKLLPVVEECAVAFSLKVLLCIVGDLPCSQGLISLRYCEYKSLRALRICENPMEKDQQVNAYFSMEIPPNNMENSITESCSEQSLNMLNIESMLADPLTKKYFRSPNDKIYKFNL